MNSTSKSHREGFGTHDGWILPLPLEQMNVSIKGMIHIAMTRRHSSDLLTWHGHISKFLHVNCWLFLTKSDGGTQRMWDTYTLSTYIFGKGNSALSALDFSYKSPNFHEFPQLLGEVLSFFLWVLLGAGGQILIFTEDFQVDSCMEAPDADAWGASESGISFFAPWSVVEFCWGFSRQTVEVIKTLLFQALVSLVGDFNDLEHFHPDPWGHDSHFDECAYFSKRLKRSTSN